MKTVLFETQEYTFSDAIIYFTQIFPVCPNQVKQSVSLAVLVCSIENVTFRLEVHVDDGRNHF